MFFSFLCSRISDLTLGILKILIGVCFRNVLQPAFSQICSWHDMTLSQWYSEGTVFTVNLYYLQILAMYKRVLSQTKSVMDKSVFLYW